MTHLNEINRWIKPRLHHNSRLRLFLTALHGYTNTVHFRRETSVSLLVSLQHQNCQKVNENIEKCTENMGKTSMISMKMTLLQRVNLDEKPRTVLQRESSHLNSQVLRLRIHFITQHNSTDCDKAVHIHE